jgi:signal transduction histidine kinase
VKGDPTQAFQAVMNLCTNALQAMPEGGMLRVNTKRAMVESDRVLSHSRLVAGDYVVLSVSDQGAGIAPEVMNRLFEPFFTTRAAQSGTGLGLAVVHGVVAGLGGAIHVERGRDGGACFTIYLPVSGERVCASPHRQAAAALGASSPMSSATPRHPL